MQGSAGAPAPTLAPEIFPQLDVMGGEKIPELLFPQGWRRFAHSTAVTATIGNRCRTRLTVKANVNALVVPELITVESSVAQSLVMDVLGTANAGAVLAGASFPNHLGRDFRQNNTGGSRTTGSVVVLSTNNDAGAATSGIYWTQSLLAATPASPYLDGLVLTDGEAIELDLFAAVAGSMNVNFFWRERSMLQAERNP